MKQSRLASFLESSGNTLTGFFLSLGCQFGFLVWWKGLPMTWHDNLEFAVFMTFISVARGYGWRRLMEALHVRIPLSAFAIAVLAERRRQSDVEGFTPEHDDLKHEPGELAHAAAAYAMNGASNDYDEGQPPACWPWTPDWWRPDGKRRDLVKAGALLLAAGEQFDRVRRRIEKDIGPGVRR